MFDYLKIEKPLCRGKDKLNFDKLVWRGVYANGSNRYELSNGFQPLQVFVNENTNLLSLDGSLPYYWQGHNFSFSNQAFYNSIETIESLMWVSLLDAKVIAFEYGKMLKVERPPKEYLSRHGNLVGYKKTTYTDGIQFSDNVSRIKLYDAGKRLKTTSAKNIIGSLKAVGFDSKANYLRFETHYLKPQIKFKQEITVEQLFSNDFQETLCIDLGDIYQKIDKMKQSKIPTDKKILNSSTIPILCLKEVAEMCGLDAKVILFNYLKKIDVFDKNDRKNRKRQLTENLKKIHDSQVQVFEYDLTPKLKSL